MMLCEAGPVPLQGHRRAEKGLNQDGNFEDVFREGKPKPRLQVSFGEFICTGGQGLEIGRPPMV